MTVLRTEGTIHPGGAWRGTSNACTPTRKRTTKRGSAKHRAARWYEHARTYRSSDLAGSTQDLRCSPVVLILAHGPAVAQPPRQTKPPCNTELLSPQLGPFSAGDKKGDRTNMSRTHDHHFGVATIFHVARQSFPPSICGNQPSLHPVLGVKQQHCSRPRHWLWKASMVSFHRCCSRWCCNYCGCFQRKLGRNDANLWRSLPTWESIGRPGV